MEGLSYIVGEYIEYPASSNGLVPLGWGEDCWSASDIYRYNGGGEVWVLTYSNNRISPLSKIWIRQSDFNESIIPAKYPRATLPDTYDGNRVLAVARMDKRVVGGFLPSGYTSDTNLVSSWTGYRYR